MELNSPAGLTACNKLGVAEALMQRTVFGETVTIYCTIKRLLDCRCGYLH